MKKIGILGLGLTFAGCFLGAGYVSGKELWQYFGSFGYSGIVGLIFAVALQLAFGLMLIKLSEHTGILELDKIIIRKEFPALRAIVGGASVFFMFGVFVLMAAGAGALLNRVLKLDYTLSCALFCLVVAFCAYFGLSGMVKGFAVIVPLLTISCAIICVLQLSGGLKIELSESESSPILGGWAVSALNYAAYNMFSTIGILCPVALNIKKGKTALSGVALGSLILLFLALGIILSIATRPDLSSSELPMLEIAFENSYLLGVVYSAILFLGMYGASLSSLVACKTYLDEKSDLLRRHKISLILALSLLAFLGSLFGFGELVGVVYPICGYLGIIALILIAEHYLHVRKNMKKGENK